MADVVVSISAWSEAFHFVPKDEHLVMLLQHRLLGRLPGIQGINIRNVDVYDDLTPHEIFAKSEFRGPNETDKQRYCFTRLKRTTPGGKRFIRTTGGGTWRLQRGAGITGGAAIKRSFTYKRSKSSSTEPQGRPDDDCGWVMYEYSLASPQFQGQDIALCKIIKKNSPRKRDRSEEDDEEDMLRNGSSKSSRLLETSNIEEKSMTLDENPCYEAGLWASSVSSTISPNGDGICVRPTSEVENNEGLYEGGDELVPWMTMMPSRPSDDFALMLEELLDDTTMMPTYPDQVDLCASTISPNGDVICTRPTSEAENENSIKTMMPNDPCDDFTLMLEELLDDTTSTNPCIEAGGDESVPSTTSCPSDDFALFLVKNY